MNSTPLSRALSSVYMWKLQSPHRRALIELNPVALEGQQPACIVTLVRPDGTGAEGTGGTLPEAVKAALEKDAHS